MLVVVRGLTDARSWSLIENTLFLVAGTLAISLPVGTALAVALFRTNLRFRRLAMVLLCIPLLVPLYMQAVAWQAAFGPTGWYRLLDSAPYRAGLLDGWRARFGFMPPRQSRGSR